MKHFVHKLHKILTNFTAMWEQASKLSMVHNTKQLKIEKSHMEFFFVHSLLLSETYFGLKASYYGLKFTSGF